MSTVSRKNKTMNTPPPPTKSRVQKAREFIRRILCEHDKTVLSQISFGGVYTKKCKKCSHVEIVRR